MADRRLCSDRSSRPFARGRKRSKTHFQRMTISRYARHWGDPISEPGRSACLISPFLALPQQFLLENGAYRHCLSQRAPTGNVTETGSEERRIL
jgi:hypothetical protein